MIFSYISPNRRQTIGKVDTSFRLLLLQFAVNEEIDMQRHAKTRIQGCR